MKGCRGRTVGCVARVPPGTVRDLRFASLFYNESYRRTYKNPGFWTIYDITEPRFSVQCCGKVHPVLFFALIVLRVMVGADPARYIHVALQIGVVKDMHGEGSHSSLATVWIRE